MISRGLVALGLVVAFALASGGCGRAVGVGQLATTTPSPSLTATLPPGPYDSLSVDQKKQYLGTPQQQQIAAASQTATPVSNPPIAPLPTERAWATGPYEGGGTPPIPPPQFVTVNAWAGKVNNMKVLVYAGGSGQDGPNAQGMLLVWLFPTDMGVVKLYPTPTAHGFVRVMSWSGSQVTAQTPSGTGYVFDIGAAQFI